MAKKYFDVDEINHENSELCRNGYYTTTDGYGGTPDLCNGVSSLTNNFDGTYTAEVYRYYTRGDKPDNIHDKDTDWNLAPNQKIIDSDAIDYSNISDDNIYKLHKNTLTLKPYEGSWQIVKINDFTIPKKLLF